MNKIRLTVVLLFMIGIALHAQNAVTSTGGLASSTSGKATYVVGQVMQQQLGTATTVTEGVLQPYIISETTPVNDNTIDCQLSAYPNPTKDILYLNIVRQESSDLRYGLYTLDGRCILSKDINQDKTEINMQALSPTTYFVKIEADNKILKTFKIIKN